MPEDGIAGFALTRAAPAKINLALHVVGQRADGHHLLESLVTFADRGDRIGLTPSDEDRFTLSGPFAAELSATGDDQGGNLVLQARDLLRQVLASQRLDTTPVHIHLEKNLPIASGIGGGSADAAATLRGLLDLWQTSIEPALLAALALKLGADVPMCLDGRPLIARGIGEEITPAFELPSFPIVLVNPLLAVSTPVIFRTLEKKNNPPLVIPGGLASRAAWLSAMATMRNDLEPPARLLQPVIADVSDALTASGAALVRMSGSGATCFGLFDSDESAQRAAHTLSAAHREWYVLGSRTAGRGT
ncbi:4-(cytidine 5'-diphospho)-2-C-methyl-D-erythritol kinase [Ensifer canadensis]